MGSSCKKGFPLRFRPTPEALRNLVMAAKGELKSDIIITGANLVDVILGDIREKVNIAVWGGHVVRVGYFDIDKYRGSDTIVIDASKAEAVVPGFIDPHVHIESSLLTPTGFAKAVIPHGTTTVAADPHEIGNVLGVEGVKYFIEESRCVPMRMFLYAPSCVPPTKAGLDTPGEVIDAEGIKELIGYEEVIGLGEVMDFISVTNGDLEYMEKIATALNAGKIVDGHAPQLPSEMLVPYAAAWIRGDHESVFLDEALTKLRNGMRVLIREGSAWQDLEELSKLLTFMKISTRYLTFATDDIEVLDLLADGHMDRVLRRAVSHGIDPITAVQMATLNAAEYLKLEEVGAIAPGRFADIVILEDFLRFRVRDVIIGGRLVWSKGSFIEGFGEYKYPEKARRTVNVASAPRPEDLLIKVPEDAKAARVLAIRAIPGKAITRSEEITAPAANGYLRLPEGDVAHIAVIERHHATGNIGKGFVTGLGLRVGALAQTIAHDVHNIVTVGKDPADMAKAVKELIDLGGGLVAVMAGKVVGKVPLPIAGLVSDEDPERVAERLRGYIDALKGMGANFHAIFMTVALLPLPVIPEVRVTDKGMVNVLEGKIIDPIKEIIK